MSKFEQFGLLSGSEREIFPAEELCETLEDFSLTVTLLLKRKLALNLENTILNKNFLSRSQLEDEHGAAFEDLKVVFEFAKHFGLRVVYSSMCQRTVVLEGTAMQMSAAFKVKLVDCRHGQRLLHTRRGPIFLPSELLSIVTGVFGLDNRPQAKPHFRLSTGHRRQALKPNAFDGSQLANIYNFPNGTGKGQTIGLIELGGGFSEQDLILYFEALNLPCPVVKSVSVGGTSNAPGLDFDEDTEVALDIEVAGAAAPDATIVVYFAPNTDQGFLQAVSTAVHDSTNQPNIISISWGGAESTWTNQQVIAVDGVFQAAAALGISVFVASGDDGADDNIGDGNAHVDFPASSPSVTACGGTSLSVKNGVRQESVWNDGDDSASGGGISNVFARPAYQQGLSMPKNLNGDLQGRGLPDLSGNADPDTGYAVLVDGIWSVVGGTSAVAPLMAGLAARLNEVNGRSSGLINTTLYQAQGAGSYDIVGGNNSCDGVIGYSAVVGWDPVTGWGSPNGISLQKSLS